MPKGKGEDKFYTILGGYPKFWEVFYLVWPLILHYFDGIDDHRFYNIWYIQIVWAMRKVKGDHRFYTILGGSPNFWEVFY